MNKYECIVCGLIYDEALGWPEDGIEPGTRWEDVPDDWMCPDCGVGKEDFELIKVESSDTGTVTVARDENAGIVIIGTGLAGYGLAKEIRKIDKTSPITLITRDGGESYSKPMLSTGFTKNVLAKDLIQSESTDMASNLGVEVLRNTTVTSIDPDTQTLTLDQESRSSLRYSKLVLALGANVINPPIQGDAKDKTFSINDLNDYAKFRAALERYESRDICVIGAGLIGCEYTNDLVNGGYRVQVVDALATCLPTLVPEVAGKAIQSSLESKGVSFNFGTVVNRVDHAGESVTVSLANGEILKADIVVSAVGVRPSTELAKQAGLKVNRGICADRYLRSSVKNIYAIGDCVEVEGLVMVYVAPLMAQARALAKTLTVEDTAVEYPPMPIVVKVPACPTVVAPPDKQLSGDWSVEADGINIKAEFRTEAGDLRGFVLTGTFVEEKRLLQTQLPPLLT